MPKDGGSTVKTASLAMAFLLVVCLAASLAACGGGGGGAPTAEEPTTRPTASPTVSPPAGGKIAFYSDRDGNGEVYVMNADGSDQTNLTNNPAYDGTPAWSP